MINPVEIVEITKKTPIFKDGSEANSIELVNFKFKNGDECGFNVISQKNLYEIGDKACYIQPDYCLSSLAIFDSFTKPDGNPSKTKLGKNNRVRAIKFNFTLKDSVDVIYSFGVLLPKSEVDTFLGLDSDVDNITDEINICNMKTKVASLCNGETVFGLTFKTDGSSHTTFFKKTDERYRVGICSRGFEKKMDQKMVVGYVDSEGNKYHPYFDKETKTKGWFCDALNKFITNEETSGLTEELSDVKDSWVELAKSTGLLDKGLEFCKEHDLQLAFRGEIYGQGLKGSGNKNNPDANKKQGLILFGVDDLSEGFSKRVNYSSKHNLQTICEELGLEYTKPILVTPSSYDELAMTCENIFKEEKANGRIIEGLVIRTHYTNDVSCKYMNAEYDAKK